MRNLKKVLSLVLALAMSLSLFAVASASYKDFTDADEIDHNEAVAQLVELGVINGKEDGSYFDPDGIVTRAEMAKMITVVLNGGVDPVLGVKDTPTFTDIKGNWAESYIEYCTGTGIINGRGNGTFGPNDTVTTTEAAKMLLVTLGYDPEIFKLTGNGWDTQTNILANNSNNDLYDELKDLNANAGLTREHAAQMIYNALSAKIMEVSYDKVVNNGEISYNYGVSDEKTLLTEKFNANIYTGVLLATPNSHISGAPKSGDTAGKDKSIINVTSKNDVDVKTGEEYNLTVNVAIDDSLLGQEVKVIIKDNAKKDVYGNAYATENNRVVTVTNKPSESNLKSLFSNADLSTTIKDAVISVNGNGSTANPYDDYKALRDGYTDKDNEKHDGLLGNGITVTLISNDDNNSVDVILVDRYSVGKVTTYRTTGDGYITIDNQSGEEKTITSDDPNGDDDTKVVIGFENVAKDDIVTYYVDAKGRTVVTPCESISVVVDKKSGDDIVAGSTTYKAAAVAKNKIDGDKATLTSIVELNESATLYLDANGYVVFVDDVNTAKNYLLVTGVDNKKDEGFESSTIKAVLEDGTKVTADVIKVDGKKIDSEDFEAWPEKDKLYAYTVNSSGEYSLKNDGSYKPVKLEGVAIDKGNPSIGDYTANSKTVFVISTNSGDSYSVYTGISNVISVEETTVYVALDGTTVKYAFVKNAESSDTTESSIYVLKQAPTGVSQSGDDYVNEYKIVVDGILPTSGDPVLVSNVDEEAGEDLIDTGLFLGIDLDADGRFKPTDLYDTVNGEKVSKAIPFSDAKAAKDGVIQTEDSVYYLPNGKVQTGAATYNDNTKVIEIDGSDAKPSSIDEIVTKDGKITQIVIVTGDNDVTKTASRVADVVYIIK